jgi:uncharacterized protein YheU (UPF0270 family)
MNLLKYYLREQFKDVAFGRSLRLDHIRRFISLSCLLHLMNNGADLGQAYRSLESEAETLETLLQKGEIRLSQEQINSKLEALKKMSVLKARITKALEAFQARSTS